MSSPDGIEAALLRAVGAYIRATPAPELPGRLRPLRGFTPRGLARHRTTLLAALDDEALRARMGEWLDQKPALERADAEELKAALAQGAEWRALLVPASGRPTAPTPGKSGDATAPAALEREKQKVRAVREELRRAREEAKRALDAERTAHAETVRALRAAEKRAESAATAIARAEDEARRAGDLLERERRKARSEGERARERLDEVKARLRASRAETRSLERRLGELEKGATRAAAAETPTPSGRGGGRRRPLTVPKGLLPEHPETLEVWLLERDDARLLIDGYNVTLAEGGFGSLDLQTQRTRLVQEVARIARKYDVEATVIFDGSSVAPGTFRRPRGPVEVHYSKPPEKADDHLVELLKTLPPDPVIVITNDRELRERVGAHGATVAGSGQLLALLR